LVYAKDGLMNEGIEQAWCRALRSGRFTQGYGSLASYHLGGDEVVHCCLGVLCELAIDERAIDAGLRTVDTLGSVWFDDQENSLPASVVHWAGLPCVDPMVSIEQALACLEGEDKARAERTGALAQAGMGFTYLSVLNDGGVSFAGIATIIERCGLISGEPAG
jgi:hypothetical protein